MIPFCRLIREKARSPKISATEPSSAQASAGTQAKRRSKNSVITAPQEGIVGVSAFTPGNYITPNSGTLVTIIENQPIRVRFSLSVADLFAMFGTHRELMEDGMVALTLADGSTYPEKGEIELLNNEANARTDTIQIYASFPNAERKLVTGNTLSRRPATTPEVTPAR